MFSFLGIGKNKSKEEKGIIGRFYENDQPVILKFVNNLPNKKIIDTLPFLTVISWKYDGTNNNGMPPEKTNTRMITLEGALKKSMDKTNIFTHVYSRTGNNLKELVYYSTLQEDFMIILNQTLKNHDAYPIEINFYEDKDWTDFKNILNNFETKNPD
ncbi:DUF695 domain-containing protein [Meridianimaribacter flavus]